MRGRARDEAHRIATPLELFFDLVFVIAVAQASEGLHHAIVANHAGEGITRFLMAFFGIWWAWMNFTWFASAYDTDDVPYRILVFVQMTGALVFTAGIEQMFAAQDFRAGVAGYVIMRFAMVGQWLRAARGDPAHRPAATRYAIGIAVIQVIWVAMLSVRPSLFVPAFAFFCIVEMLIPVWAEQVGMTPWHPHHVAERYCLMTIIVLGESVLAATTATQAALRGGAPLGELAPLLAGGLLIVFSLWWLYFDRPAHDLLTTLTRSMIWGYGHYVVFSSAAAVGAGLAIAVDHAVGGAPSLSRQAATAVVSIPVALFLGSLWYLHGRHGHRVNPWTMSAALALLLVAPLVPQGVLFSGAVLIGLLASKLMAADKRISGRAGKRLSG